MAKFAELKITPIAWTTFVAPEHVPWEPDEDAPSAESLIEFAGRACYQSWNRPNNLTASNASYIRNVLSQGHMSVFEHASITFYIEGVSRSLTHELIRHRHLSYSQLSQRYVDSSDTRFIMPPEARDAWDKIGRGITESAADAQISAYEEFSEWLLAKAGVTVDKRPTVDQRKIVRQTARSVLGNFTETKIVVTGNLRAWRHFVNMRATLAADTEIRECAIEVLLYLKQLFPSVFDDYVITTDTEGRQFATGIQTEV